MVKVLAALVNYGDEQLNYLQQVVSELKSFKKYDVTVVVNSNIPLDNITGIDKVNVLNIPDYQYLPMTCRQVIKQNSENFDYFIFSENDHLWEEHHIDKYIEYEDILPKDRIAGLFQIEKDDSGLFYPAYHAHYEWDWDSVEEHGGKLFAHFTNVHQASFLISKQQLSDIMSKFDFAQYFTSHAPYSTKCRTNTDIYMFTGRRKLICISEFDQNLIHHLPNVYITGAYGYRREDGQIVHRRQQGSRDDRMRNALNRLLKK